MKCFALTGISPDVIQELHKGRPRTLELQSAHNVVTLAGLDPGAAVFMTSVDMEDLDPGDTGIIVEIIAISITMKRMMEFTQGYHFEERERMSARIKVRCIGSSIVKSVTHEGIMHPVSVDVVKSACYHAG
ncbi:MAG TPA: DUF473 domain-containing protein [Methanoregulaceae archaeon]|nr:DUF473 domain-containing protein [Methanoregulaceae archaeon]HQN88550.1 DUF473 domain-containing protein [Methanoregulaceae archaeon]